MKALRNSFREISRYPSAVFGLLIILAIVGLAIFTVVTIPYDEAIRFWRGAEDTIYKNPRNAPPVWYNWFTKNDLPASFDVTTEDTEEFTKTVTPREGGNTYDFSYTFDYSYDTPPQEIFLYIRSNYADKNPFVAITLKTPSGEEIKVSDFGATSRSFNFRFNQDEGLLKRLSRLHGRTITNAMQGLFTVLKSDPPAVDKGTYTMDIKVTGFEPETDVNLELVMHGVVFGPFGTDQMRRDLTTAILWGAPIALAFGLLAAVGTSVLSMLIAAIGAWFGGWVDELIQRVTEVNMILPYFSILIMIGTFYSRSIWVILGATIALNIFTGVIKADRAIFLQVKESTYIEAARAYGAGDWRIIVRYLLPRIIPTIIPGLVSAVPAYVFLEASLALLGLGDPTIPTWGKVINDAYQNGALYKGMFYWILEPATLLMITGLGFAMLGFSLDRIFNPRLRGM